LRPDSALPGYGWVILGSVGIMASVVFTAGTMFLQTRSIALADPRPPASVTPRANGFTLVREIGGMVPTATSRAAAPTATVRAPAALPTDGPVADDAGEPAAAARTRSVAAANPPTNPPLAVALPLARAAAAPSPPPALAAASAPNLEPPAAPPPADPTATFTPIPPTARPTPAISPTPMPPRYTVAASAPVLRGVPTKDSRASAAFIPTPGPAAELPPAGPPRGPDVPPGPPPAPPMALPWPVNRADLQVAPQVYFVPTIVAAPTSVPTPTPARPAPTLPPGSWKP
jgi:hypothetical protein